MFIFDLILAIIFLYLWLKVKKQLKQKTSEYDALFIKYSPIMEVEKELEKLKREQQELEEKRSSVNLELDKMNQEKIFIQNIIDTYSESYELIEFGFYKPRFNFENSEKYKERLSKIISNQKEMISNDSALKSTIAWTVSGSDKEGQKMIKEYKKLMLTAFNGECSSLINKVRYDNIEKYTDKMIKERDIINKLGDRQGISITEEYLNLKIEELRLAFELQEKLYEEKEEQKRIKEQMREEEKVRRELEKMEKQAADEEKRYAKALEEAKAKLANVHGEELDAMNSEIAKLQQMLAEATAQKERAMSQAQLTKSGHIYIISNIGSFGENVYKIGMTRRLEPMERIWELGDAAVPFDFDVHAMIYSDNAPELENKLHRYFDSKRKNMINRKKEFFNVSIDEIEKIVKESHSDIEIMKIAEAKEYRETLALINNLNQ